MSSDTNLDNSSDHVSADPAHQTNSEHDTLKYHLLGPSLTKAGQDTVDQTKVSEIIYNASKGSKFFNNEEVKDRNLTEKINRILASKHELERLDPTVELRRADDYIAELELSRDLSQNIVHVDCDAFFAAVEELDRPELKDVPMAVGKGVLTTCNYHARKFGCRSGMASFVAKKLCPQLICLPQNFDKYSSKAEEVRAILAEYDPRFESASIDEAYLNITEYCIAHSMTPEDAVFQMRAVIHEKTKITVSAGIAANAKLAKICSNRNKPNGQFLLASDRTTIMAFMRDLSTRKVNGIGRVFERELDAIGIKNIGDIYDQRAYLSKLFGQKAFQFLMHCYLGLGRTTIAPAEEYERKSVGTESTFRDAKGTAVLREKLRHTAEELQKDLERSQCKGRTLVLKVKLHTYEVLTRQTVPPFALYKADDLYKYSLPMLTKLEKEIPGLSLRLLGLRVTNLASTKKAGIDFFGAYKRKEAIKPLPEGSSGTSKHLSTQADNGEWEVWPEAEFEDAARQELQDEMDELEQLSQEREREGDFNPTPATNPVKELPQSEVSPSEPDYYLCPICQIPQDASPISFNAHIDSCLSRQTIKEVVRATKTDSSIPNSIKSTKPSQQSNSRASKKRGRSRNDSTSAQNEKTDKRRFFFSKVDA